MSCSPVEFVAGETIYLRHWQRDQLGLLFPMQVVDHNGEGLLLWAPTGTQGWHYNMPDGRTMSETPLPEWSAVHRVPVAHRLNHGLLSWHPLGRDYSIRWFFRPDAEFYSWYANLEAPAAPWRDAELGGVDTADWDLDVVIRPDRRWEWKDEDEFATRLTMPDAYWVDDADRVRRAGADVIDLVEAAAFPFDGTWCDFRPDPAWPPIPAGFPAGADRPRAAQHETTAPRPH